MLSKEDVAVTAVVVVVVGVVVEAAEEPWETPDTPSIKSRRLNTKQEITILSGLNYVQLK